MFVMSQPLNPLTLPLSGSWLIEASAGTSKPPWPRCMCGWRWATARTMARGCRR